MSITLILPVPPSVNRYWRYFKGRIVVSDEGVQYKHDVQMICYHHDLTPLDGMVRVTVKVYREVKKGDLDNFFKALFDALKGQTYHDDAQVCEIHAYKYDDKKNPRVEVTVEAMEK